MSLIFADRVKETTNTTGTSATITIIGAETGYQSFGSAMIAGDTCYYCEENGAGGQWETGIATFVNSTTLTKAVITSSNSNAPVNFASGAKNVFITQTSHAFNNTRVKQLNVLLSVNNQTTVSATTVVSVSEAAGSDSVSLIPLMTSATAPSGVLSTSGISAGSIQDAVNGGQTVVTNGTSGWYQYQFTVQKSIARYALGSGGTSGFWGIPTSWTLSGSNNGTNWTTLHTSDTYARTDFDVVNTKSFVLSAIATYQYFRLNFLSSAIGTTGTSPGLQRFGLYSASECTVLVPGTDYSVTKAILTTGAQTNTVKRLKAGTAINHLIEYI